MNSSPSSAPSSRQPHEPPADKMPGHWLLARMGKRVLRPGGLELTRQLLAILDISERDEVVEFAPGLGVTARMTLARKPRSYTAIERDREAAAAVEILLAKPHQQCIVGNAEQTGLPDGSASVVYGEAMLSMQPAAAKSRIVAEAGRLLQPGGRYGIHELCLVPDEVDEAARRSIQCGLSDEIHVGVRPLTVGEWRELLESAGLTVLAERTAPMKLLEPTRIIRDEGWSRAVRFVWNVARDRVARRRVLSMRSVFRKFRHNLAAVALVAMKRQEVRS
jgi:SAM-dependent methyltransferase